MPQEFTGLGHFGLRLPKGAQKGGTPCFDQFFSKIPGSHPPGGKPARFPEIRREGSLGARDLPRIVFFRWGGGSPITPHSGSGRSSAYFTGYFLRGVLDAMGVGRGDPPSKWGVQYSVWGQNKSSGGPLRWPTGGVPFSLLACILWETSLAHRFYRKSPQNRQKVPQMGYPLEQNFRKLLDLWTTHEGLTNSGPFALGG